MNLEKLQKLVELSAQQVYEKDQALIKLTGNEQSIVFRFALYFNQFLEKEGLLQNGLCLDSEYNKFEADPKRLRVDLIRPDLLLHKRLSQANNLLVIECKRNKPRDGDDFSKLTALTSAPNYNYQLGCFINFANHAPEFTYFIGGEIAENLAKVIV